MSRPATTDLEETHTFPDAAAFEAWLEAHHEDATGVWLKVAKKGSGATSVTTTEALDVALCFGWIDAQRRSHDATHFLQRYTRRRPRSTWSQVNVDKVAALTAAGRMRPAGEVEVAAAKADGRWEAAYPSQRTASTPPDLVAALDASPAARAAFEALGRSDRYQAFLPLLLARTSETRAARLDRLITDLAGAPAERVGDGRDQ